VQGDVSEEIEEFLLDHYKVIPEDNIGMSFLPFNSRVISSRDLEHVLMRDSQLLSSQNIYQNIILTQSSLR